MSAFDKIIGYSSIKKELIQISDTLRNPEPYKKLGVAAPKGLLLYGEPGVGKSLMASAVIEESGRKTFCCRKDSPNGDFVKKIKNIFDEALENAPSIVYLDDMDKFANEDRANSNAEEYITVQSCIDAVKEKQVFVLGTANNIRCLPDSLYRMGRFDRKIKVNTPHGKDSEKIIRYYLKSKSAADELDPSVIAKIMNGRSCAELETVINEAGLYAGYDRAESITMDHFLKAFLRTIFNIFPEDDCEEVQPDVSQCHYSPDDLILQIAYHEAGHAVISEILCPESVALISVYHSNQEKAGFTSYQNDRSGSPLYWGKSRIISALGGIAAIEQKFGIYDIGGESDLDKAFSLVNRLVTGICINGFRLHDNGPENSQQLLAEQEQAVSIEIEKYYRKAKEVLSSNWEFFEKIAAALVQKKLLSASDVQKIKSECRIVPVAL